MASHSTVCTLACGPDGLLDRRGGSRRWGKSTIGFKGRSTGDAAFLLLLPGMATLTVAFETGKFLLDSATC